MSNRTTLFARILLLVVIMASLAYLLAPYLANDKAGDTSPPTETVSFTKEGSLAFLKNDSLLVAIDIEYAATPHERNRGLMNRPTLPPSAGMLFVFEESEPRAFWMKNTIVPLDIIYVDENKKIISIAAHTTPYSEQDIPSNGNAQYVVEVNAGFSATHQIQVGDAISF
ncbi:hypothetical protein CLV98_12517 [Dyadobacter jejuensis]|uniref:DUF192 domain-containing protein n=1 Tax=Dyadobacter jejuensis TaxID=1082580 RepID=A0A316A8R1_9BACT|nr:DUF192 domain-containing protein [Dyadobacter jejuensis]PWJ53234.1 hypothetical protein CLV98_12517 [Dyadobacter jejuensis]